MKQNKATHKITPEDRELIKKLWTEGKTSFQIAELLNTTDSTVRNHAKSMGLIVKLGRASRALTDIETKALDMVKSGSSMPDAIRATGIDRVRLWKLVKSHKVEVERVYRVLSVEEEQESFLAIKQNHSESAKKRLTNEQMSGKLGLKRNAVKKIKKKLGLRYSESDKLKYTPEDVQMACSSLGFEIIELGKVVTNAKFTVQCHCGQKFDTLVDSVLRSNVNSCGCLKSLPQQKITEFVENLGLECVKNDNTLLKIGSQKSKEIDIYIPSKNFAIEYNGLHWHTENKGDGALYHYNKYKMLKDKQIQLITIFEDEWLEREEVVKSAIAAKLGLIKQSLGARKCELIVDCPELAQFIEQNHLQGDSHGTRLGLTHNGQIVAAMVFKKNSRLSGDIELSRFCCKAGLRVSGAFSRLLRAYINQYRPSKIISFSDNRWSDGTVYKNNGFRMDGNVPHSYSYVVGKKRIHKSNYKLSELRKKGLLIEGESERECTMRNGIFRIYDCGKIRWSLTPS